MKKLLTLALLTSSVLFAATGKSIYTKYCASCHLEKSKVDEDKATLKAPPMNRVSQRLKMNTASKQEFIAYVKDYIQYPSQEKGFCRPKAYKRFGVMPPIGKAMSEEERQLVAVWLYRHFKVSKGRNCANEDQKSSKCGGGKNMKCGGQ
jgi:mono/diheme cytochrome c family protein